MILEDTDGREAMLSRSGRKRSFLYRQLADILRKDISSGKYMPGERLPSMDSLASMYEVNKVTVRHALAELRDEGLIYAVPAQGTYIAEPDRPQDEMPMTGIPTVGLLSHVLAVDQPGYYHMEMIEGIRDEQSRTRINLVMLPVKYVQPQHRIVDLVQQSSLDVALLIGHFDRELLTGIVEVCPRIVLVDHMMRGLNVDTILVDNREGGYAAMECLIAHGHRKRIGVITGPRNQLVTRERLAGVFECIEQHDLSRDTLRIAEGDFLFKGGYDTARRLLQDNPPTALFVMNDEMAAGAVQAIHEHTRLRIPEDISVIGFDDSAVSRQTRKPLSTIHISKPLMGRLAVQRAVALMKKDAHAPITTVVPTRLIERETTGPCSRT